MTMPPLAGPPLAPPPLAAPIRPRPAGALARLMRRKLALFGMALIALVAEWTLGQRVVFEVGQEPIVALLRLQKGEVDVPGDGIPPAKFTEVMADPAQAARVVQGGPLHTGYITLTVTIPPFDDVRVRKAVNMAINKARITQITNGRAGPRPRAPSVRLTGDMPSPIHPVGGGPERVTLRDVGGGHLAALG